MLGPQISIPIAFVRQIRQILTSGMGPKAVSPVPMNKVNKVDIHSAFETRTTGSNLLRRAMRDSDENYIYSIALYTSPK